MALRGFLCESKDGNGGRVSFEQCQACADTRNNACHYTSEIIRGMIANLEERDFLTVTELSGCPRETYLKRHYDYWIEPPYFLLRGLIAHKAMEDYAKPGCIKETRFYRKFNGVVLSGMPDLIDTEKGKLLDYKTTKKVPNFYRLSSGVYMCYGYPNHKEQLNLYRLILQNAYHFRYIDDLSGREERVSERWNLDQLLVVYMSMEKVRIATVPVWNDKMAKKYIDTYLTMFNYAFNKKVLYKRGFCQSYEDKPFRKTFRWKCNGYCSVEQLCAELARKEH